MYVLVNLINLKSSTLWKLVAAVGMVLLLLFYMTDQCQYWFKSFNPVVCVCIMHFWSQNVLRVSQNLRAWHVLVRLNMHTGTLSYICLFWGKSVIGGFYFHHFRQSCGWYSGTGRFYFHHFRQHGGWWCFFSHHFRQSCNWWVLFSLFQTKLWLVGCNSHQDWPERLHPQ